MRRAIAIVADGTLHRTFRTTARPFRGIF
jgi:hypothetical protein